MIRIFSSASTCKWMVKSCRLYAESLSKPSRNFHSAFVSRVSLTPSSKIKKYANITFILPENREIQVKAEVGQTFLDIVLDNNLDIDGYGACEGTLACSTCHLIFTPADFARIEKEQRKISDDEEDMLDLAKGRIDESRLGCQVKVAEWMEGIKITVPDSSDVRVG